MKDDLRDYSQACVALGDLLRDYRHLPADQQEAMLICGILWLLELYHPKEDRAKAAKRIAVEIIRFVSLIDEEPLTTLAPSYGSTCF